MAVDNRKLTERLERQAKRLKKAEEDRPTLLAQTVFTGTLGLLLVLPIVGGAYLGHWLDGLEEGYTVRWTFGMIMLGLIIGALNVYFFIKDRE